MKKAQIHVQELQTKMQGGGVRVRSSSSKGEGGGGGGGGDVPLDFHRMEAAMGAAKVGLEFRVSIPTVHYCLLPSMTLSLWSAAAFPQPRLLLLSPIAGCKFKFNSKIPIAG